MAENTKIEWCDHTFNPWIGCTKVSPGCAHCYAESLMDKRLGKVVWGKGNPRSRTSEQNWNKVIGWDRLAMEHGERPRVFCASLADWLDDEVPIHWLVDLLNLIMVTPYLDWLLLTKRPEKWKSQTQEALAEIAECDWADEEESALYKWLYAWTEGKAPLNVWLGTSAEDQQRWDERLPYLMEIPAKVRFVSAEPLLGPIEMNDWYPEWLIVGGESGPGARPINDRWVRSLEKQSRHDNTAFFFKQWGGVNKKETGRLLDGVTYGEFPLHNA